MKVTIENEYIVIRLKMWKPRLSNSGKSMLVASTRGPRRSNVKIRGKVVRVSASAFYDRVNRKKIGVS